MKLTWDQVLAWRLRRQLLEPRGRESPVEIARRICGVQAQVGSSAELAVAVRQAEPRRGEIERVLDERLLVRTWAMRGTLHLLPSDVVGAYLALVATVRSWERASWQRASGLTPSDLALLAEVVSEALDGRVLTRDELVREVIARTGRDALEEKLRSGWGGLLKPLAWQGVLCNGPSAGNRVTFARPDQWLPDWGGVPEPEAAAHVVIPAYLHAHGPATMETFDAWLTRGSSRKASLRSWFAALGERLVPVEIEDETAYALAEDVDALRSTRPISTVRLLPGFDQYVLGPGTGDVRIVPAHRRAEVSKAAGWISPVVVAGGRVAGTWALNGDELTATIFDETGRLPEGEVEAEVTRLAAYLDRDLRLTISRS